MLSEVSRNQGREVRGEFLEENSCYRTVKIRTLKKKAFIFFPKNSMKFLISGSIMNQSPTGMNQTALRVNTASGYQCRQKKTRQAKKSENRLLGSPRSTVNVPLLDYGKFQSQGPVFWSLGLHPYQGAFAD